MKHEISAEIQERQELKDALLLKENVGGVEFGAASEQICLRGFFEQIVEVTDPQVTRQLVAFWSWYDDQEFSKVNTCHAPRLEFR